MTIQPHPWPAELLQRAAHVRALLLDVDGVLTDGGLYYGDPTADQAEVFKRFHSLDGHGIKLLAQGGIRCAVITGRDSPALRRRLADLGISHAHYGIADKLAAAQQVLADLCLDWPQAAVMGDDWPDLPLLCRAGVACVPRDAHEAVKARAHWVSAYGGGQGAVRELCDLVLWATGHYSRLLAEASQ
jgi:3-deoxy-D-manno-octulosonate 8-phosphate phosphatase (KDO 8-P phosphatase)